MSRWPYNTAHWEALKQICHRRDNWQCQWPGCGRDLVRGRTLPHSAVLDHIIGHEIRPDLAFDTDNLQTLCKFHHDKLKQSEERRGYSTAVDQDGFPIDPKHPSNTGRMPRRWGFSIPAGVQPSAIPVTLVCGAPASGKSTYVERHAEPGDTIIDFDLIRQKLGGRKWQTGGYVTRRAFRYRDAIIRGLKDKRRGRAWLIVTAPTQAERDEWCEALGDVSVHVMDTPEDVCIDRVKASPERQETAADQIRAIGRWFSPDGG